MQVSVNGHWRAVSANNSGRHFFVDGVAQMLGIQRLEQDQTVRTGRGFDGFDRIAAGGNEYNRNLPALCSQLCVQIQPAQTCHLDIENQAAVPITASGCKKILCGAEWLHLIIHRVQDTLECAPDQRIIVNDGYGAVSQLNFSR